MPTLQIPKLEGEGNSLEGDTRVPICREFHVQNKEVGPAAFLCIFAEPLCAFRQGRGVEDAAPVWHDGETASPR